MLDVLLANKLIKAIPPGAHLLLVGDVDQLPSVGAGEVLRHLLAADRLPRVRLTHIFRQAQQSGVVTNAHRINAGQPPITRGSVGQVTTTSLEDHELRVLLDGDEEVGYGFDELDELTQAYAVSIHRSQGSEYPCVVIPPTTGAWLMLQRNLLYTAVTRAKRIVVLVGSRRALAKAFRTQGAGPSLHCPLPPAPTQGSIQRIPRR